MFSILVLGFVIIAGNYSYISCMVFLLELQSSVPALRIYFCHFLTMHLRILLFQLIVDLQPCAQ